MNLKACRTVEMSGSKFSIEFIDGLTPSDHRGVVFLKHDDGTLDAASVFDCLDDSPRRTVLTRFDHWIIGSKNDRWFHGWPNEKKFSNCFTFKWKYRGVMNRFYGFLCHPQPNARPRYQLCTLHSHALKHNWNTDPSYLRLAENLKDDSSVVEAIETCFPDKKLN